jgi:hypothetical protein
MVSISGTLDTNMAAIMERSRSRMRLGTRRNVPEVLRKFSKSIMLCDDQVIIHSLIEYGVALGGFADSILKLAKGITVE